MSAVEPGVPGLEDGGAGAAWRAGRHLATRESIRHFAVAIGAMAAIHHDVAKARARGSQ